jgi:hypothetical protein
MGPASSGNRILCELWIYLILYTEAETEGNIERVQRGTREGWGGRFVVARDLSAAAQDGGFAGRRASGPNETQQKEWHWRLYRAAGGRSKGPKDDPEVASRDRLEEEWPWAVYGVDRSCQSRAAT